MIALEARGAGKRYGRVWALENCDLAIPAGHVVALVGPNGAGKSTLLHLTVGVARLSAGELTVLGEPAGSARARDQIGFVAQDTPLYKNLSAEETLRLGRDMNRSWDERLAADRLRAVGVPLKRKVGGLSAGQQSQLALTLALATRPRLLILDEPMASLDPVARHDFMASLMESVSQHGISVVLSSHVVSELERVADYLVILNHGTVTLAGPVDELLAEHVLAAGPRLSQDDQHAWPGAVSQMTAMGYSSVLVRTRDRATLPPGWQLSELGLEDLVLAYLRQPAAAGQEHPVPGRLHRAVT